MEQVTREHLKEWKACKDGYKFWCDHCEGLSNIEQIRTLLEWNDICYRTQKKNLIADYHIEWANWLVVRIMTRKQRIKYAIFAAEQVIDIFEKQYPNDVEPRAAIAAAKKVLKEDIEENREATSAAGSAASAYAAAAYAAAADYNARIANFEPYVAAKATRADTLSTIVKYGIKLIEREEK